MWNMAWSVIHQALVPIVYRRTLFNLILLEGPNSGWLADHLFFQIIMEKYTKGGYVLEEKSYLVPSMCVFVQKS